MQLSTSSAYKNKHQHTKMKLTLFDGPTLYDVEQWVASSKCAPIAKEEEWIFATTTGVYILLDGEYKYKHVTTKIGNIATLSLSHRTEIDKLVAVQQIPEHNNILYSTQIEKLTYATIEPDIQFVVEINKATRDVISYYFNIDAPYFDSDVIITAAAAVDLQYKIDYIFTQIEETVCGQNKYK